MEVGNMEEKRESEALVWFVMGLILIGTVML
jgi:hypothetical protein